ncbi:5-formyltetrahydrofolate cyclo-ligase [Burkholderiales bacterium]|nr:5-formyltetrahydrofolate cyclo-ligase [Burkholderiales bacterium]
MDIKQQKIQLRKLILEKRDGLAVAYRIGISEAISDRILSMNSFKQSRVVAAYVSFGSEFQTDIVINESLRLGKKIVLPKIECSSRLLSFRTFSGNVNELLSGRWGIPEPDPEKSQLVDYSKIDFMVVPGVAFSKQGFRLGYGGGYYDSAMSSLPKSSVTVAPVFPIQIVPDVPREAHDLKVDVLLTI